MQALLKRAIFLSVILILLVLCFGKTALAEGIILNDLKGNPVDLSSYKGKPVIFFFWTTWCSYCRKEIKVLNQKYAQMEKEGIVIFAVNVGESIHKVGVFFKDQSLKFSVLLDKDGELAVKYEIMGVPTYIILDKSGQVVAQEHTLPENYKSLLQITKQ